MSTPGFAEFEQKWLDARPENRVVLVRDAAVALAAGIGLSLLAYSIHAILVARFPAYALLSIGAPALLVVVGHGERAASE